MLVTEVPPQISEARLRSVLRHIEHVKDSCLLLAEKLREAGEPDIAIKLIANGLIHDNSKLRGIEWLYLHEDVKLKCPENFKKAYYHHVTTNPHHPEYWDGIEKMPRQYLAEMVCDWYARSYEFGTDLVDWIKAKALARFNFGVADKVYEDIEEFINLMLQRKFE